MCSFKPQWQSHGAGAYVPLPREAPRRPRLAPRPCSVTGFHAREQTALQHARHLPTVHTTHSTAEGWQKQLRHSLDTVGTGTDLVRKGLVTGASGSRTCPTPATGNTECAANCLLIKEVSLTNSYYKSRKTDKNEI